MRLSRMFAAVMAAGFAGVPAAQAQAITRLAGPNPKSPIAVLLPGYTLYYISGTPAAPAKPDAPKGSPERMGDTPTQTDSSLDRSA